MVLGCGLAGVSQGESIMSLRFTDEEFQNAWKELDEPQLEGGWELFVETMGVKIYRLYDKVGNLQSNCCFCCRKSDSASQFE